MSFSTFICRSHRLKERLRSKYPQLMFHRPSNRSSSEFVYVAKVDVGPLIETMWSSASESEESEASSLERSPVKRRPHSSVHLLYSAAMTIREDLRARGKVGLPWPPSISDINLNAAGLSILYQDWVTVCHIIHSSTWRQLSPKLC